ncbi:MAG: argininosuccinate lyase [Bacteroidales bacterium]|nr:argininosuccinate lyase [Bacteroidales bacterium]
MGNNNSYQTLWSKGVQASKAVEDFTVGNDNILDLKIAKHDVLGSKAHIKMLSTIGLLEKEEEKVLSSALDEIYENILKGEFEIEDGIEDIHSQVEMLLTRKLGELGKKIHSGRSRNDQVLVDIKLFFREELLNIKGDVIRLFEKLQALSEEHKHTLLPGYTHGQVAMPSSFGMWFGAYAETLADDMIMIRAAYDIVNQNPLGSAAGYGNSFPLDREMTTELLGFRTLNYNSIAAQMSRGKSEKAVANAIASVASTLNKLAADCCEYMCSNYGFISFPDELTTGSSIMPHKKNPDVWEIIRAKSNRLQSIPNELSMLCTNLPHGYHRDFQLLKDVTFPAIEEIRKCITMTLLMLDNIRINDHILDDPKYDYLFTVERVNRLALEGTPFRDAYKQVGLEVKNGTFKKDENCSPLLHTHEGSIGNLSTLKIKDKMDKNSEF